MRRLSTCCIALFLIIIPTTFCFASLRDVQYHWSRDIVNTLFENNIVSGYEDGRFRPENQMTRVEFSMLLVSFGRQQGIIDEAALQNLVDLADNLYSTDTRLTRGEMAQILYNYKTNFEGYVFQENMEDFELYPLDIEGDSAETAIKALCSAGVINGYENKTFKPKNYITRAEVCTALFKMSNLELVPMNVTLRRYNVIEIPYISQIYPVSAPVGCEGTALLMGLKSKGYAVGMDLKTFLDDMPKDIENPARGFVGSPYKADRTKRTRTTIYPTKLSEYGKRYGSVLDFSGSTINEIRGELLMGNPVVVYATLYWEKPFYRTYTIDNQQVKLLSNNHVVLVAGYNADKDEYFICDPYNKAAPQTELKYWVDGATFEGIYNERKHAVVIE